MNTLVLCFFSVLWIGVVCSSHYPGILAKTAVLHTGYLADTHEVAASKGAHIAAFDKYSYGHGYGGDYGYGGNYGNSQGHEHAYSHDDHDHLKYHGPTAIPHVLHNGHIADTHEVAAAKAEHLVAVSKAKVHSGYGHGYNGEYASGYGSDYGYGGNYGYSQGHEHVYSHDDHDHLLYHGPTAIPHVLHDGHIADTHEVAAAKAKHLVAVSKAKVHSGHGHGYNGEYVSGYGSDYGYGGNYGYSHGHEHVYSHNDHGHFRYHGPTAIPHVLHDGYIADTHEVAAAKDRHLAAVSKAKVHGGYGHGYSGVYASGYGGSQVYSHHSAPYHGPLANPVVFNSGYIEDTHEVAAHPIHSLHSASLLGHSSYHH